MQKTNTIIPLLFFISVLAFTMIPQTMATLPNGNGIQNINEHIHVDEPTYFTRGYYYNPWYPALSSGQIKVGTWLNIGFGSAGVAHEDVLEEAIADHITWIQSQPLSLTFDGEEINIVDCWRFNDVIIIHLGDGMVLYYIPFRYYIPPRAPGCYEIVLESGGMPFVGYVEWVPPNQL